MVSHGKGNLMTPLAQLTCDGKLCRPLESDARSVCRADWLDLLSPSIMPPCFANCSLNA